MPNNNTTAEEDEIQMKSHCTDTLCFAIFVISSALLVVFSGIAIAYGNPERILNGYDSFGNVCGTKNPKLGNLENSGLDMTDRRYLFFFDVKNIFSSVKLCVKECPNRDLNSPADVQAFAKQTGTFLCFYNIHADDYTKPDPLSDGNVQGWDYVCPVLPVYQSSPILRRCVPKFNGPGREASIDNIHRYLNSIDMFQKIFNNFYTSWKYLVVLVFFAFVIGGVLFSLLYFINYATVKIITGFLLISSIVTVSLLWWTYAQNKQQLDSTTFGELLDETVWNEDAFLVFSVLATLVLLGVWFLVWHVHDRLIELPALFNCANECIQDMLFLLVQPVATFVVMLGFIVIWVYVMLCLSTANTPSRIHISPLQSIESEIHERQLVEITLNISLEKVRKTVIEYTDHNWVYFTWFFSVFMFFWINEFILACQHMVVAGAVARWYFRRKIKLDSPIVKSLKHTVILHIGSLAIGSMLITIFKLPRLLVKYIMNRWKYFRSSRSASARSSCQEDMCTSSWGKRIANLLFRINHNAYVIIVVVDSRLSFWAAAKQAYQIEKLHTSRALSIIRGGDCLLFFCKSIVTCTVTCAALLLMKRDPMLHYYAIPAFVLCISSFFIAHCVLSLYEIVIDTLFLCYYDEARQNKVTMEEDYCASKSFHAFMLELEDERLRANSGNESETAPGDV